MTFVPAAVALFVTGEVKEKESRWMMMLKKGYAGLLDKAYAFRYVVVTAAVSILILTGAIATRVVVSLRLNSVRGFCLATHACAKYWYRGIT